jgi:uncharacterized membrane protein
MATPTATRKRKVGAAGSDSPVRRRRATPPSSNGHGATPRTPVAKAKKAAAKNPGKAVAKKAGKTVAKKALVPGGSGGHLARRLAARGLKKLAAKMLQAGAETARTAAEHLSEGLPEMVQRVMTPRVPVQRSIDVAVPIRVAWEEWMALESLPEGAHRVHEIERDGDALYGRLDVSGQPEWRAEVTDEREQESFAWRSLQGSDCAGLITFHQLSDRLTRLELDLDALPTSPTEAVALNTPLAQRRAALELRRFKAHVEFINPDTYEPDDDSDDTD